ncbi:hypothetical protein [Pseudomonas citronellolis]|uniref:hypothetical protein n=1 Tax=Pseudomonas citronellolis TaxID=53408 RepID=UPI0023E46E1F|nr:hypothetical protein [Pseudomonas citronellolis]MDF3932135.1 hypothetical protein [Pseudomonas citronellolis]
MIDIWEDVCRIVGESWSVTPAQRQEALQCCAGLGVPGITVIGALWRRADEVLAAAPAAEIERRVHELNEQARLGGQRERIALGYSEGRRLGNRFLGPRKVARTRRALADRIRREIDALRNEERRLEAELKRRAHAEARA